MASEAIIDGSHPDYLRAKIVTLDRQLSDLRQVCDSQKEKLNEKWISVETEYPKKGARVLVWFGDMSEPFMDAWSYDGKNQYFMPKSRAPKKQCVTHWQPLPDAPERDKEQGK